MTDAPKMSQASKEILAKVRNIVPPMLERFHKGNKKRFENHVAPPNIA